MSQRPDATSPPPHVGMPLLSIGVPARLDPDRPWAGEMAHQWRRADDRADAGAVHAERPIKAIFFDFDGTLTIGERDGALGADMRPGTMSDRVILAAFGGQQRLQFLHETFCELRRRGVTMLLLTEAPSGNVFGALERTRLIEFFRKAPASDDAARPVIVGEMHDYRIWSGVDARAERDTATKLDYVREKVDQMGMRPSQAVVVDEDNVVRADVRKHDAAATVPTSRNGMSDDVLNELLSLAETD